MNVTAMEWAARQPIRHMTARALLIQIAALVDNDFSCVVRLQDLAVGISRDAGTARTAIRLLQDQGLVTRQYRFGDDGRRLTNRYCLNHPDAPAPDQHRSHSYVHSPEKRKEGPPNSPNFPSRLHPVGRPESTPSNDGNPTDTHQRRHKPRSGIPGGDPVLPLDLGETHPGDAMAQISSGTEHYTTNNNRIT